MKMTRFVAGWSSALVQSGVSKNQEMCINRPSSPGEDFLKPTFFFSAGESRRQITMFFHLENSAMRLHCLLGSGH